MKFPALVIAVILGLSLPAFPEKKKQNGETSMLSVVEDQKGKKKRKKEVEPATQVLELPKDPPSAVVGAADRLSFQVTPLSARGLLSQQVRDGLKWLVRPDRPTLKLRAFVAGTGDTRRVQAIVSEVFTERKLALPALTVVQVGALPLEGAQVQLEAVSLEKKPVNPGGLVFTPAQGAFSDRPLEAVLPHAEQALSKIRELLLPAGVNAEDVVALTCYVTSLDDIDKVRGAAASRFPKAAQTFVQALRGALQSGASCEAAARLLKAPPEPLVVLKAPDAAQTAAGSPVAVGPVRLALSGAQLAFGPKEEDARLAVQRLAKSLEQVGAGLDRAALVRIYILSRPAGELAQKAASEVFDRGRPPAVSVLPFEGLPSMDASFAVDAIVVLPDPKQE